MARTYKSGFDAQKFETKKFHETFEQHFIDGTPISYAGSRCYNTPRGTIESRKKQAEVIKYFLNHPCESYASVERKFGCGPRYVARVLERYPKIKMQIAESRDKEILNMYEDVLYDIAEITARNIKSYKESEQQLRTNELKDLSSIAKDTNERKNLMEGKPTENQNITININ